MNRNLFEAINSWPDSLAPFFHFLSEANKFWPVRIFVLVLVVAMLIWGRTRGRSTIILAIVAAAIANEVADGLKALIHSPRPCVELADVHMRVRVLTSSGTISAHAANTAAVAFVFTYLLGRWGWPWIVLSLLVGLSRVYVGVHYPSQVLFGWSCGILVGLTVVKVFELAVAKLGKRPEMAEDENT